MNSIFENYGLIKKYDIDCFDYTDYPHKSFWSEKIGDFEYRNALISLFRKEKHAPVIFYIHVPFCRSLCLYCICHKEITKNYDKILNHFNNFLLKEVIMLRDFFLNKKLVPNIKEIFFGGGSPTLLRANEFNILVDVLCSFIDIKKLNRFCIEVDPRTVTVETLSYYKEKNVNTISMGIQDFDPSVQESVNRIQPFEMVSGLMEHSRNLFKSINFDLIMGLPLQTITSIQKTINDIIVLSPDRISFDYFRYNPKFYPHMRGIAHLLPDSIERRKVFAVAIDLLINAGYIRTGFEHFAKPDDIVAKALENKRATYTSLGAITGDCPNVVAVGRSGHGIIGENYLFQNYYEQNLYGKSLENNEFPIYRGYVLNQDDILRRNIIRNLRTYFEIDINQIENEIRQPFNNYFHRELEILNEFERDGLVMKTDKKVSMTENGKHFAELIASVFDNHVTSPRFNKNGSSHS